MELEFERDADRLVLKLNGDLFVESGLKLRNAILNELGQAAAACVLLDFSAVPRVDSIGLGALLSIVKALKQARTAFGVFGLNPEVKKLFEITKLSKIIPLAETRAAALQLLEDKSDEQHP